MKNTPNASTRSRPGGITWWRSLKRLQPCAKRSNERFIIRVALALIPVACVSCDLAPEQRNSGEDYDAVVAIQRDESDEDMRFSFEYSAPGYLTEDLLPAGSCSTPFQLYFAVRTFGERKISELNAAGIERLDPGRRQQLLGQFRDASASSDRTSALGGMDSVVKAIIDLQTIYVRLTHVYAHARFVTASDYEPRISEREELTIEPTLWAAWGDFDGDGKRDLAVLMIFDEERCDIVVALGGSDRAPFRMETQTEYVPQALTLTIETEPAGEIWSKSRHSIDENENAEVEIPSTFIAAAQWDYIELGDFATDNVTAIYWDGELFQSAYVGL